jgi:GTP pyrophosphokinase
MNVSETPFRTTTTLGERFDRAVAYALHIHAAQRRKQSGVPYVAHVLGVASIALEFGATETEAIAALLHDAIEDCGGSSQADQIRARFGDEVHDIVAGCTDSFDPDETGRKIPWYDRKLAYIERLDRHARGTAPILLVSASDKLHNLLATWNDGLRSGEDVFGRFQAKKYGTLWYYRALADAFARHPGRHAAIARRLTDIVDVIAGKHVKAEELLKKFASDPDVLDREKGSLLERALA